MKTPDFHILILHENGPGLDLWGHVAEHALTVQQCRRDAFFCVDDAHQRALTVLGKIRAMDLPNHGMVWKGWVNHFTKQPSTPLVLMPCDDNPYDSTDKMVIVNSIVLYESHKRARVE